METNTRSKGRVLIVDDEFIVRDSIGKWLSSEGYAALPVPGAWQALEEIRRTEYDLALVDIQMPGMDGMELQERLREARPELRVIIITGYPSPDTQEQARRTGACAYVTKPVDPDELSRLVAATLGLGAGLGAAPAR